MSKKAAFLFIVSMDVQPDKEALFNEVYDQEHIPSLLALPGVLSARRSKSEDFSVSVGGEIKSIPAASPRYTAIYELENADILTSEAWTQAVEAGRWPGEVRPYTFNRHHSLQKLI